MNVCTFVDFEINAHLKKTFLVVLLLTQILFLQEGGLIIDSIPLCYRCARFAILLSSTKTSTIPDSFYIANPLHKDLSNPFVPVSSLATFFI